MSHDFDSEVSKGCLVLFCGDGATETMPTFLSEYTEFNYVKEVTDLTGADAEKYMEVVSKIVGNWKKAKEDSEYEHPESTVIKIDITTCIARWKQLQWLMSAHRYYATTIFIYDDSYDLKKYKSGESEWPISLLRKYIDFAILL